jgi:hypothetical protein
MDAAIAFPAELGIQNRFLLVSQGCIKLVNVGVGQASGTSNPLLGCIVSFKYNDTRAVVSYTGGGDLGPADPITVPLTRLKWGTVVRLTVSAQPRGGDPVTLTAAVDEIGDYLCRSTLPAPAGSIRFFDGSLFIGAANLTAGICDDPSTASLSVVRPVGTSNFRAEFSESVSHLGGVSDVVAATIR